MRVDKAECPSCGAALNIDASFCSSCGTKVVVAMEDAKLGVVHSQLVLYCPICGRAAPPTEQFRCAVCKREHLCAGHQVAGRQLTAGQKSVTIPTCCEECFRSLLQTNAAAIRHIKEARRCAKCRMMNCRYQCRACGKYFCGNHVDEMCKEHKKTRTFFICHNCGVICEHCARGGKKCRRCGERVRPANRYDIDQRCPSTEMW